MKARAHQLLLALSHENACARSAIRRRACRWLTPLHTGVLIAIFHGYAPSRRGAFADEQRILPGDEGVRMRARKAQSSPLGQCGFRGRVDDRSCRTRFGGPVVANASRFPPFDPIREPGARTDSALFPPVRPSPPSVAMRRALADEGRIVAGDEGERVRTRNAHPDPRISRPRSTAPTCRIRKCHRAFSR